MRTVELNDLAALARNHHPLSISIYMPSHRGGSQTRQDPIRFRNLLRMAEQQLVEHGIGHGTAQKRLAALHDLIHDTGFWRNQDSGLAVFLNDKTQEIFSLPYDTEQIVFIGDNFYLKPLLPMISRDAPFFILALSQDQVRTFECTRYSINEVHIKGVPQSYADYTRFVEPQDSLRMYTSRRGESGPHTLVFHGHGAAADEANNKRQQEQFCHMVDEKINRHLATRRLPLILAAAEPLAGMYHKLNQYPHLHQQTLHGNPERLQKDELLKQANQLLGEYFNDCTRQASEAYKIAAAQGKGMNDPKAIVAAALEGKIDSLLVSVEDHLWGQIDAASHETTLHERRQKGDDDLLDLAARESVRHGGAVFGLERGEMPDGLMAAATLRYATPSAANDAAVP